MARFLFASTPIEGHSSSPLSVMERLVRTGHEVSWLAGAAYAERGRRLGVRHVPFTHWTDYSGHDPFDFFPQLRGRSGVGLIKAGFRDVFIQEARNQVLDIEAALDDTRADVLVADPLAFGAPLVSERRGIPYAGIGDGPFATTSPDAPPFGPGLRLWGGPVGRLRNRTLNALTRLVFRDVDRALTDMRVEHGLPPEHPWVFDSMVSPHLYLQGCVPEFEYPYRNIPDQVRFVGALRPPIPADWTPPVWWDDLDAARHRRRPVVHVTQGTIRPDVDELIRPAIRALDGEDVLVVVTTGTGDPAALGRLPANVRVAPFVPYERLLERASLFVTNGGYIGTNLALHHGVPIVQIGATEEKPEIGARIAYTGVGVAMRRVPSVARLRSTILATLRDPAIRVRVAAVASSYQRHHAPTECADALVMLAARRSAVS
ncbi:MAG: nucleotide disphospho-sugar-binding domain-containing protein [Ilumatobacteraceae bacterium]